MSKEMTTEEIVWHYEFGVDSGIPRCCILFWIDEYSSGIGDTKIWPEGAKLWTSFYMGLINHNCPEVEYIPCPNCLNRKDFVEIKKCGPRYPRPF